MHREILSAKFLKVCEDLQHYRGTIYQIILDTFKLGGSDFVVSLFILFLLGKEFVFWISNLRPRSYECKKFTKKEETQMKKAFLKKFVICILKFYF